MKILKNKNYQSQGFTLIELLIVMVIIGIILGFVVIAFGDFGRKREVIMKQNHLADLIKLASMRAVIESKTYALSINEKNYHFYELTNPKKAPHGHWKTLKNTVFKSQTLAKHKSFKYAHPSNLSMPEIIISTQGNITPFQLTLGLVGNEKVQLEANKKGEVNVTATD